MPANYAKKLISLVLKHKIASILFGVAIIAAVGVLTLKHFKILSAAAYGSIRDFKESYCGIFLQYPFDWAITSDYSRYSPGICDIGLNNKKCWVGFSECKSDCVDIKIFVGKEPASDQANDLGAQLYRQLQIIKLSDNKDLVERIDVAGIRVFKVKSTAPTAALNGACAGPLYAFESNSGYFVYIFSGFGNKISYAAGEETVKQIIASIKI
jgi:hypothetical protein